MRIAAAALIALAVSPAAAETAISANGACEVRFVRAPDDVRHVIEGWLAAEPRCTSSIDLRVIPIDDGFYLLAQRPDGRLHERVVPDAQAAGVIVASWVADDWVEPPPPPAPVAPRPIIVNPFADQPERGITARAQVARRGNPKSLTLAAMIQAGGEGGGGLRGEIDLIHRGAWTFGAALTASSAGYKVNEVASYQTEDYRAVAYVARTVRFKHWQLRFAGGAGVLATEAHITRDSYGAQPGAYTATGATSLVVETSVTASLQLTRNWSVSGGPIVSLMSQDLVYFDPGTWDSMYLHTVREDEVMFAGGLRYSL